MLTLNILPGVFLLLNPQRLKVVTVMSRRRKKIDKTRARLKLLIVLNIKFASMFYQLNNLQKAFFLHGKNGKYFSIYIYLFCIYHLIYSGNITKCYDLTLFLYKSCKNRFTKLYSQLRM